MLFQGPNYRLAGRRKSISSSRRPTQLLARLSEPIRPARYSALTIKARRASIPFTFAEAERDDAGGQASWIFNFSRSYNMRDGLYCTYRAWAVVFISTKLLAVRLSQRAFLAAAAQAAIGRIEDIVNLRRKRRRGKKINAFDMTARELEVLQQRALLGQ